MNQIQNLHFKWISTKNVTRQTETQVIKVYNLDYLFDVAHACKCYEFN